MRASLADDRGLGGRVVRGHLQVEAVGDARHFKAGQTAAFTVPPLSTRARAPLRSLEAGKGTPRGIGGVGRQSSVGRSFGDRGLVSFVFMWRKRQEEEARGEMGRGERRVELEKAVPASAQTQQAHTLLNNTQLLQPRLASKRHLTSTLPDRAIAIAHLRDRERERGTPPLRPSSAR